MSTWVDVKGTIKGEHLSSMKAITEFFDEVIISFVEDGEVEFRFCDEGLSAAQRLNNFISNLRERFKGCYIDLYATIKF